MPCPHLIFSQSVYLIWAIATNSNTKWQTVQIQISWLLQKPTDLDLHCLQSRAYQGSAGQGLKLRVKHIRAGTLYTSSIQIVRSKQTV